jgi:hypothetical protein
VWDRTAHGEDAGAWGSAEGGDAEHVVVLVSGR